MNINKIITSTVKLFVLEQNLMNQTWYHGSNKPIKKFLFSLIGKNSERISSYHGYGIYFIDNIERAKKYGNIIIKVNIKPDSNILHKNVTPEQLQKIYKQAKLENFELTDRDYETFNNPSYGEYSVMTDVEEFYDYILRKFRKYLINNEGVSRFLMRSGIDGMQVVNDVNDNILVVFNEDIINIISNP